MPERVMEKGTGAPPALRSRKLARVALALALALGAGCAATAARPRAGGAVPGDAAGSLTTAEDHARLTALSAARAEGAPAGYRIGPDDLLIVRVPDLLVADPVRVARGGAPGAGPAAVAGTPAFEEGLRVGPGGEIRLPVLGPIAAAGLTTAELESALAERLVAEGILRAPQVSVRIAEYRSAVVAVVGSVERSGLYPITQPGATVADLVWAAGGPTKDAGRVVDLVPAAAPGGAAGGRQRPIRLDLALLLQDAGTRDRDLNPPVRPGDVIRIGAAGSVLVAGWVEKPGSYPVTNGLTVSGAVAAAGGHLFPADRGAVRVRRVLAPGQEELFTVDLDAIAAGAAPDVPISDGDIVSLPADTVRLVPYGLYNVVREMVHVGGSVLLF
jgi:polysaccharide export outer membrane protein